MPIPDSKPSKYRCRTIIHHNCHPIIPNLSQIRYIHRYKKSLFYNIYRKYLPISSYFIYIYSSKNIIFHKTTYNTVYTEKSHIFKKSHFFNFCQKTHIYKKYYFVKIRVFSNNNYFLYAHFLGYVENVSFLIYVKFPDIWEIAVLLKNPIFRTTKKRLFLGPQKTRFFRSTKMAVFEVLKKVDF